MIIYERNIEDFINQCKPGNHDLLVSEIKANMRKKMGRGVSPKEEESWRRTLVQLGKLLSNIESKRDQYILLEFKVPTTLKRIDVILVGSDGKKNSLLIIELKGWSESLQSDVDGALRINARYGNNVAHPSKEAEEYKYILTSQFSDINNEFANLKAVSLLPNYELLKNDPLISEQFRALIEYIEVYTKSNINDFILLINNLFKRGIPRTTVDFLNKLEYKPTLAFQKHLENQFEDIKLSTSQEMAFNTIKRQINIHLKNPSNKKLITISGMPGSGKTIVAFKVLAHLLINNNLLAKLQLPGPEFREAVKVLLKSNDFSNMIGGAHAKSDSQVIIIDEAHKAKGNGNAKQLFSQFFDNQNFVITLIDNNQVVDKRGISKSEIIEKAIDRNFDVIEIDLSEQFRNGGDALYIDWLSNWIYKDDNQQEWFVNNSYDFKVLGDKDFNETYKNMYDKFNVRMASFWTQKWNAYLDENGNAEKRIKVGSYKYVWNPNDSWIKAHQKEFPNEKIPSSFIRDVVNKNFNVEKKGYQYIAYFNTIQGSEFEYIFVHVPKLFFLNENDELDVDLSQLDMTEMKTQVWTTKGVPDPNKEELNKLYFKNRLLVNLTRGTKGTYVFFEDPKLQEWVKKKLIRK